MKTLFSTVLTLSLSVAAFAAPGGGRGDIDRDFRNEFKSESKPKVVSWVGFVEADGGHTTRHDHDLEFVRKSDGESFDIVDSPELENVYCEKSKRLLVKIEAERTGRFLFWGDNLIVKKFEILEELEDAPHKKYQPKTAKFIGERR